MNYRDNDNVPFGVSSTDAAAAGINSWDYPEVAQAKLQTKMLEQQSEAQRAVYAAQDVARNQQPASYQPVGKSTAYAAQGSPMGQPKPTELEYLQATSILTTVQLARILEGDRQYLESDRERQTKSPRQLRTTAFVALGITSLIVVLGLKLPFIPYQYGLVEYWGVKAILVASIVLIFKLSATISRAATPAEKRVTALAECMVAAFKGCYKVKLHAVEKDCSTNYLLGRFDVPALALTAKFLHQWNQRIEKKTGAPMPYSIYRFKDAKHWDRAFFIPFADTLDPKTAPHADPVSLEELARLANESA